MRRWMRWVEVGILGFGLAASLLPAATVPADQPEIAPSNSVYVTMRDGVELAVSIYLPPDFKVGEKLPVLMRTTRYWREPQMAPPLKTLVALHLVRSDILLDQLVTYFRKRRFVVLLVDARGSGASGGHRVIEFSSAEIADMGEVAAWAAEQRWSNGHVGTFGISYEGNTAELAAISHQPPIRALMPLYDTFDNWDNFGEGGVAFSSFLREWSDIVSALDRDDVCGAEEVKGWRCWRLRLAVSGVRRVDADPKGKHLAELLSQRHNWDVAKSVGDVQFKDDRMPTEVGPFSMADISPYGLRAKIEASKLPMMVWCGWLDGDSSGTLIRYRTFTNPQFVVIGPLSHGGDFNVDPFASKHKPPMPPAEDQVKMMADFFDRLLRSDTPETIESSIQYYTMGEGQWHTTKAWPPAELSSERLYLDEHHTLSRTVPSAATASDSYTVDFTASSGKHNRWMTGLGGGDVIYPDRKDEDKKLLLYTSTPLVTDLEITGTPVLTLEMSSTPSDGAIHAYLEDVFSEGNVTYVDEGVFRLIDRKEVNPKGLPYEPLGPAHSFLREDAEPLKPGEAVTIRFSLCPTSVLLRKGHRIRIALAGADASMFKRYPAEGTPTWTVYREAQRASFLELPVRHNRETSR